MDAAKAEEIQAVTRDPSLRGKTMKEMNLEPFRQTEIRLAVMGIPITIREEVIAKACRVAPTGRFLWNVSRNHPLLESFKSVVLKGNPATKLVDIDGHHRMLLKFLTDCFLQKGGGSDQPSVDHKLVLYFLSAFDKINVTQKDFPPISKERNPEVLAEQIATYVKESEGIIVDDDTPNVADEAPLRVRGKRAKSDDGLEAVGVQTKKSKKDKSEASNPECIPATAPKRKRGKG